MIVLFRVSVCWYFDIMINIPRHEASIERLGSYEYLDSCQKTIKYTYYMFFC